MDVVVCIKRVPFTQEVDLEIEAGGRDVKKGPLAFVTNDWDNYAVEEAISLKERLGGMVTAMTVGVEDDEEVLRRALAMGADRAVRIDPEGRELDPFSLARILAEAIRGIPCDLVLTGVQAEDDNYGMVGILIAEYLGLHRAAVVREIQPEESELTVKIELEGGVDEVARVRLPALLTIQSGINEPRYVSVLGIRKAGKKELLVKGVSDLGLPEEAFVPQIRVEELSLPSEAKGAEMIEGDPGTVAGRILEILKKMGVGK